MSANPRLTQRRRLLALAATVPAIVLIALGGGTQASAADDPIGLGVATSFGVLGGTKVTNTGPTVVSGDVGVSPDTAITGFTGPPNGSVIAGTIHAADGVAGQAQTDLVTAYDEAAGLATTVTVSAPLGGGPALAPGVYTASSSMSLDGILTLDAGNVAGALFVFQAGSTLTTASSSSVVLINGADACNVYWQVGSSATLGTTSSMVGTVMALESITATTGVTVSGRLLARNGAVTLDSNTVTRPLCEEPTATTTTASPTTSDAPTTTAGPVTTLPGETTTTAGSVTTTAAPVTTTAAPVTTTTADAPTTTTAGPTTTVPVLSTIVTGPTGTLPGTPTDGQGSGNPTPTTEVSAFGTTTVPGTMTQTDGRGTTTTSADITTGTTPGTTTDTLARTGSNTDRQVIAGVLAILVGGALVLTSRRTVTERGE